MGFNFNDSLMPIGVDMMASSFNYDDLDLDQDEPDIDRIEPDGENDDLSDFDPFEDDADITDADDFDDGIEETDTFDEGINEVDLDPDPTDSEPDWNPTDEGWDEKSTDISQEDDGDKDTDDNDSAETDVEEETTPEEEIRQEDDIEQEDRHTILEETDTEEPILWEDGDDFDLNPGDEIEEDIFFDASDPGGEAFVEDVISYPSQELDDFVYDVEIDPAIDLTQLQNIIDADPEVFFPEYYTPGQFDNGDEDLLNISDLTDDVFVDVGIDDTLGDPFFSLMDTDDFLMA